MNRTIQILVAIASLISLNGHSQEVNSIQKDPKTGKDIIVGEVTREDLLKLPAWSCDEYRFTDEYDVYSPDSASVNVLRQTTDNLPFIFVVLGTWCGDSKDQIPHFFKITDLAGYPAEKIFMVAVDRDKNGGSYCLADFDINLVPTFIFTRNGTEIGRIIETPQATLEQDMVNIIVGKP